MDVYETGDFFRRQSQVCDVMYAVGRCLHSGSSWGPLLADNDSLLFDSKINELNKLFDAGPIFTPFRLHYILFG